MKVYFILFLSFVWFAPRAVSEVLHIEKYVEIGRGNWKVLVPEIYQSEKGIVVSYVFKGYPGNTYFDRWWVGQFEVPFPTIAISQTVEYPSWDETMQHPDEDVLFRGPSSYYDSSEPSFPSTFDYERSDGWVLSYTLGWINVKDYPWIWIPSLGWTYLIQNEPVWHHMSWYGFSMEYGWLFFAEGAPGWYFIFEAREDRHWISLYD